MVVIDTDITNSDEKCNHQNTNKKETLFTALKSNDMIDNVLHVITTISNVQNFKRRYELMEQFIKRMEQCDNVILYIVELAYGNQEFKITSAQNSNHLQLRTKHALWHKENMINVGIHKLLPEDWKAVAWIDGDVEFENVNWANDTLKILTKFDLVQIFTVSFDLDEHEIPMSLFQSFGYKYCNGEKFEHKRGLNYWHPGYGWACTREFYEKIGGLYDRGIVGSGDYILTQSIFGNVACGDKKLKHFHDDLKKYVDNVSNLDISIGFVPGTIKHYFHGSKAKRKYIERNNILITYDYNPLLHVQYDETGVLIPTENMPDGFLDDILEYFKQRNDDEYYELISKK